MWPWLKDALYVIGAIIVIVGAVWTSIIFLFKTKFVTKDDLVKHCEQHSTVCQRQLCLKIDGLRTTIEGHLLVDEKRKAVLDQRNIWLMRTMQSLVDSMNQINKDGRQINITDMPV